MPEITRYINYTETILSTLKKMDNEECKLLIVLKDEKFYGLVSIGDIQRALINKKSLQEPIFKILRKEIKVARDTDNLDDIKQIMQKYRIEGMPVIDKDNNLVNFLKWEDVFKERIATNIKLDIPVVIMAGGFGTRLKPLTNIIPKPLIPINDRTILENIINKFTDIGASNFYISINYKGEMIKTYLKNSSYKNLKFSFIQETSPLGTAGALFLIKEKIKTTFIVTNCDILLDINFYDLLEYHKKNNNIITLVSVIKTVNIPYGTLETGEDGILISLTEKPEVMYQINAGLYILEPEVFQYMQKNEFLHITMLIERLKNAQKKIGVFPISEGSWTDIGDWPEYLNAIKLMK